MLRASVTEEEIRRVIGLSPGGDRVIDGLAPLDSTEDRCLYFVNRKVTIAIREALAARHGCIVIAPKGSALAGEVGDCLVLESADPRAAVALVLRFIEQQQRVRPWVTVREIATDAAISPLAVVGDHVEIGAGVVIEPFCVVDSNVRIGRGSVLKSGVRVCSRVEIGAESVIGPNSVVGYHGYGFVRNELGDKTRIPHLGGVIIGSGVEIGALVTVPSGTIMPTIIEDHAKIDDHVHVGHNARVARGASVTAAAVIGGSAVIDSEAWVGINSTIRDGKHVGVRALVGMDASVQQDLAENSVARAPRPEVNIRDDDDKTTIGFTER